MFKKLLLVFFLVIQSLPVMAIDINIKDETMEQKITELKLIDLKVGEGREAEKGLSITVHYTGWLYDANAKDFKGQKFDSSLDRREPFTFILGVGQVIRGWDEGFKGMQIGGKRTIQIPSEFGYGRRGAGNVIPSNADLIFDVELLDIK
jgi:FKBP-type peptidyl-prolyl cis-trans isomerase FkpA